VHTAILSARIPVMTKYTTANLFSAVGKRTPTFFAILHSWRRGRVSADTERDPRGFALKFYTEQGNWDMVGNKHARVLHPRSA